jgi:DNA-binding transcriptional MerR regulator
MAAVTFDTLKFVKTLQAAGMDTPQAEAIASAVRESSESADVATKADVAALKSEMREMKAELKADMRELELRMTIKLGTMMAAFAALIAAIVKLL